MTAKRGLEVSDTVSKRQSIRFGLWCSARGRQKCRTGKCKTGKWRIPGGGGGAIAPLSSALSGYVSTLSKHLHMYIDGGKAASLNRAYRELCRSKCLWVDLKSLCDMIYCHMTWQ